MVEALPPSAYRTAMRAVTLAEAKERLGELLDEAIAGEEVTIARDGSPAVRLVAVDTSLVERPMQRELFPLGYMPFFNRPGA